MLIVREEAAIADPVSVDHRRDMGQPVPGRCVPGASPNGATIGKLGDDAARVRSCSDLPSVVLRTLPAIRVGEKLAAVPHIGYVN